MNYQLYAVTIGASLKTTLAFISAPTLDIASRIAEKLDFTKTLKEYCVRLVQTGQTDDFIKFFIRG